MVSMGRFHIAPTKFPFALSIDSDSHIIQEEKLPYTVSATAHIAVIYSRLYIPMYIWA